MGTESASRDVQRYLADGDWLQELARRLVQADDAQDAVQDTWLAVLRHPPDPGRPARPWLATVLRNLVRRQGRERRRRQAREQEVTALAPAVGAPASDGLERLELQRLLIELVLELEEPFRSTVVLRFLEGRSGAQIARTAGVPEGTVRWRLSEALKRLRRRLDQKTGSGWRAIAMASGKGVAVKATTKSALAVLVALLLALGALWPLLTRSASERGVGPASAGTGSADRQHIAATGPEDPGRARSLAPRPVAPPRFQPGVASAASPSTPPPGPAPARPTAAIPLDRRRDFTPDELAKLADNCEVRVDVPGMHTINDVPMGWMDDRRLLASGLHALELPAVRGALDDYRDALNQVVRRWHGALAGDPDVARDVDFLDYTTGDHPAVRAMPEHISMHQISEGARLVALELAGRAPTDPPRDPKIAETAALYRRHFELSAKFEARLARTLGPTRARALRDGPLFGRTRRAGCM